MINYVDHLEKEGWVVIPCLGEKVSMFKHNIDFKNALSIMPEFKGGRPLQMLRDGTPFVKGGMAALGNPSSFHNSYVRNIRQWAHNAALKQVFLPILQKDKRLLFEQDIDRMLFRRPPAKPGAESWHRDESLNAKEGDTIYGGWINLDTEPQYFSGCPKSHLEPDAMRRNQGFAKIDKKDYDRYKAMRKKITIAPGDIFIFYERMVHEVLPSAKKKDQCRLFLGWRTTYQSTPLVEDLLQRLDEKAVMPIKSGQIPAMYSRMHWLTNRVSKKGKPGQRDQLAEWSKNFEPQCLEVKTVKSGADAGKQWRVVHQRMKSLKQYRLLDDFNARGSYIPVYGSEEIALLFPNRKWRVYQIESTTEYDVIHADSTPPPRPPTPNIKKKKKKKRRRVMFEDDDDDDDCEEFEKHVKEKDYDYVRNWLRNEGLSMDDLCRGKTPQPPPEVIEILDSSDDEEEPPRMKKTGVTYVYKKDDYDEEDLYNEKGELLIGKKFEQSSYFLIGSGNTNGRYDINQYSAQNIGNASIDEIVDYIHNESVYTLFMELWTWHHLPNEYKGKLLGSGVKIMVIKSYEDFFNRKMPALPSDDDGDNSSSDEEMPPPPETEICPVITTMDMITKEFVDIYAPWVSKGITRQQSVRRGSASVAFWFSGDQKSGQWAYANSGQGGWRSEFAEYRTPKITSDETLNWLRILDKYSPPFTNPDGSTSTPSIFYDFIYPLNKNVDGPLKLYVQAKQGPSGKYYAIRGEREMFDMHDIKTVLPKNYMLSRDRTKFTAGQKPTYNVRIKGYYYSDHLINVQDLIAFQLAVNKVNEKYKNVELTRSSPHLSPGFVPPDNNQILGWHVKANFPEPIKKVIQDHNLQPLGACGPQREKSANETQWHYRFNINGMYDVQVNAMLSILCPVFPNIFCKQVALYNSGSFPKLNEFIQSDAIVAVCAWGTARGRSGHERLMLKRKSMGGNYLEIYDPWMQGTRKHNYGFKLIQQFLRQYNLSNWTMRKIDRPAEQASGEGSCVAISLTRAITVAEGGQLDDVTGRIPEWIPVLIKMLAVKFNTRAKARTFMVAKGKNSLVEEFDNLKF